MWKHEHWLEWLRWAQTGRNRRHDARSGPHHEPTQNTASSSKPHPSPDQRPYPVLADPDASAIRRIAVDADEDVLVVLGHPVRIDVDQRSKDVEHRRHVPRLRVNEQDVDMARRLVDEAAGPGDPVVLAIAPAAVQRPGGDRARMAVPLDRAGAPGAQDADPAAVPGVVQQRAAVAEIADRHPFRVVLQHVALEHLRDRVG